MELHFDNDQSYYEMTSEDISELNNWIDTVILTVEPDEVEVDKQYEYIEDKSNLKKIGNCVVEAYFCKSVKPEFMFLGDYSSSDENGIVIYTPPEKLQPGQYRTGYQISLRDNIYEDNLYKGPFHMSFKLGDISDNPTFTISRPIHKSLIPLVYHDRFDYEISEAEGRLYAAHCRFTTDEGRSHSLTGERATYDPFYRQISKISKLLDISEPDFINS